MNSRILTASVCGTLLTGTTTACDLCSVYSAAQARGDIGKGFFAGVAEQFTHFGTLQEDGRKIPNPAGQYLDSSISQLFAGYNFSERFGLQLNLPIVGRWYQRPDDAGNIERGSVSGIGDIALLGHFQAYRYETKQRTFSWTLLGGIKFPSGSTSRLHEEVDELNAPEPSEEEETSSLPESGVHGHDLTLGSGSIDGIVGTGLFARWNRFFFNANVQYAIRTKGDFDYEFANDLTWFGGPGAYLVLHDKYTVALQLAVTGEDKGLDTFMGMKAEDTGITSVYLGPQVAVSWKDKLSAEFGLDLPVLQNNTSLQSVPDYRVRAGLTWHF
jgi:hypothetical protein